MLNARAPVTCTPHLIVQLLIFANMGIWKFGVITSGYYYAFSPLALSLSCYTLKNLGYRIGKVPVVGNVVVIVVLIVCSAYIQPATNPVARDDFEKKVQYLPK